MTNENACCDAPEGSIASGKFGTDLYSLVIEPGWYRHTSESVEVLKCKYEFECKGGNASAVQNATRASFTNATTETNTTNVTDATNAVNTNTTAVVTRSAGNDLCNPGYEGPLCGRCIMDPPHYRDSLTHECHDCADTKGAPPNVYVIISIVTVVVAIIIYAVFKQEEISRFADKVRLSTLNPQPSTLNSQPSVR